MHSWMDGEPGKRTLFVADEASTLVVSFEEGMRCIDLMNTDTRRCVSHRQGQRYLHQTKPVLPEREGCGNCVFFHMELTDQWGRTHWLPGQMVVRTGYRWAEAAEPILIDIMNSIALFLPEQTDSLLCEEESYVFS